jgi:hypothetical protein
MRTVVLVVCLAGVAHGDVSVGSAGPAPAPPLVLDFEDPPGMRDDPARKGCEATLGRAQKSLKRRGALEITRVDGRSLLASIYLGRIGREPPVSVSVRLDCTQKSRTDAAWSARATDFEKHVGRLQASFFIPPLSATPEFIATVQSSLDRVLASAL